MISTTPPHLRCGLFQPKPRSAINSPSCFSRRRFSAWSSSANSTISTASGSPRTAVAMIGWNIAISRPSDEHGAIDQFHRNRAELHQMLGGIHRLVEAAEMADAEHLVADHRPQLQLDLRGEGERALGADQKMRHVVRRVARHQRIEIIAADAALHLWKLFRNLGGLAFAEIEHVAKQRQRRYRSSSMVRGPAPPRRNAAAVPSARAASIDSVLSRMVP